MPVHCGPGANLFIARWFLDCLYSPRDLLGFTIGMMSIGCWLVAQIPQLITNMRNKSAEALSAWFLAQWLLGDTCNLIGCLLNGDQLPTVTYTAMYFICMDVVMMMQYIYYSTLQRRLARQRSYRAIRGRHHHHHHHHRRPDASPLQPTDEEALSHQLPAASRQQTSLSRPIRVLACFGALLLVRMHWAASSSWSMPGRLADAGQVLSRRRLLWDRLPWWHWHHQILIFLHQHRPPWARRMGSIIGYMSSGLYLSSRISQIMRNHQRKSADGLSLAMFACAISANLCYGLGILVRSYSLADLVSSAPWILGSLGTVALDLTIFSQGTRYGHKPVKEDPEEPLLDDAAAQAPV